MNDSENKYTHTFLEMEHRNIIKFMWSIAVMVHGLMTRDLGQLQTQDPHVGGSSEWWDRVYPQQVLRRYQNEKSG